MEDRKIEKSLKDGDSSDANSWHIKLFPEEYDFMYDGKSEAKDRKQGINPMASEYIEKTNSRRAALGFPPYQVGEIGPNPETLSWVEDRLAAGAVADLESILKNRAQEDLQMAKDIEDNIPQASALDTQIDTILASGAFSMEGWKPEKPENIAFQLQGAIFEVAPHSQTDVLFSKQIRRILPGLTEIEYETLRKVAMKEWMDAYGY